MAAEKTSKVAGTLLHCLYAPGGELEGVLLDTDKGVIQLVIDRQDRQSADFLMGLQPGSQLQAQVHRVAQTGKSGSRHPVHVLAKLVGAGRGSAAEGFNGVVVAFHYTRHAEPNGVILDSGHFVHTGPEGLAGLLQLDVGDLIQVRGPARPLADGSGMVIEASHINGKALKKPAAKKAVKKAAKKVAKKVAGKAVTKAAVKTTGKVVKSATKVAGKASPKKGATGAGRATTAKATPRKRAAASKG